MTAYLGLGSNIGDRLENLQTAVKLLSNKVIIVETSHVYETEPVGLKEQPWFFNAVASVDTFLTAQELLDFCKEIEREMQRKETVRWGPRIIDIDVLLLGNKKIDRDTVKIPHPEMQNRAFVIIPLCEIAPSLKLPDGKNICALAAENKFSEQVIKTEVKLA